MVFWGGLICLVDITVGRFDLVNDVIGAFIIAQGVERLGVFPVSRRYTLAMRFVEIVALLGIFRSYYEQADWLEPPPFVQLGLALHFFGSLVAAIVFCVSMRWLCVATAMDFPARSWRTTTMLLAALNTIPVGISCVVAVRAIAGGESHDFHVAHELLPISLILLIPTVHLLVSLSRTVRYARHKTSFPPCHAYHAPVPKTAKPLRYSLRSLLVITAVIAIIAAFIGRPTLFYWHVTMTILLAFASALRLFAKRKPATTVFNVAFLFLVGVGGLVSSLSFSWSNNYSFNAVRGNVNMTDRALECESWLKDQGFVRNRALEAAAPFPRLGPISEPLDRKSIVAYERRFGDSAGLRVWIDSREDRKQIDFDISVEGEFKGFLWQSDAQERRVYELQDKLRRKLDEIFRR